METSLRLCNYCGCLKPYDPTQKKYSKASGFFGTRCWECNCIIMLARQNRKIIGSDGKERSWSSERRLKHQRENPGLYNAISMRHHTSKLQRTPPWADQSKITAIYTEAAAKGLQVDHIIPLRGKLVSGLHVHNNLQLLTKSENYNKSNKFEVA